jgi:type II secretory pathway pseudopilin PulG
MAELNPGAPPRQGERGFSLIEALIAAALLLILVVGLMPLFSRAMINNVQGNDASRVVNTTVDGFERLLSLPFDSFDMTLQAAATQNQIQDFYLLHGNRWVASVPVGDEEHWRRTATVRQFNISDLLDNGQLDNPLPGNATPSFVHLKVIDVAVSGGRAAEAPPFNARVVQVF